MITVRVRPTSRRRAVAVVVRVPALLRMLSAITVAPHARQTRDRPPRVAVAVIFRARNAMMHSAPRLLARRRLPHRRRTARPAAPAAVAIPRLSPGRRQVSAPRPSRRSPLLPTRLPRARSRLRAVAPVMAEGRVLPSRLLAVRPRTSKLRAVVAVVPASRVEARTVLLEVPITLHLPSR